MQAPSGRGCCNPFSMPGVSSKIAGLAQYLLEGGGFSLKALAVGVKCNSKPLGFGPAAFASQGDSGVIITKMIDNEPQQFLGIEEILRCEVVGQ